MTPAPPQGPFRYDGYELDADGRLTCRYSIGPHRFVEEVRLDTAGTAGPAPGPAPGSALDAAAIDAAARLVFLLAGVSYYKVGAPPVVDLSTLSTTAAERAFLRTFLVEGLGEFAWRNRLDLADLRIEGPTAPERRPVRWAPDRSRALVPFGGGIDSIVTVESLRAGGADLALFVVSPPGERFAAVEDAAATTGLRVVRAQRRIDRSLLRSAELGFLNGHVPVTGILSAVAVLAAAWSGRGTVVMSNEWSASSATLTVGDRTLNHQWSKSATFESAWRGLLSATFSPGPEYFSYLRARSELWVAQRFAALTRYHRVFRSCNRAFAQDPAKRLGRWCGTCDKCCFIDLVLSPYVAPEELSAVFSGREPIEDPALASRFRDLVGTGGAKPFECVGDVTECRAAMAAAAARPDRAASALLQTLAAELPDRRASLADAARLLDPLGPDFVPEAWRIEAAALR